MTCTNVLTDLGIDWKRLMRRTLRFWNKADLLAPREREEAQRAIARSGRGEILVSALDGTGLPGLLAAIDARLGSGDHVLLIDLPPSEGRLLSWLHDNSDLLAQEIDDDGTQHLKVPHRSEARGKLDSLLKRAGIAARKARAPRKRRRAAE